MRIQILASGSTGNATFVEINNTRFLIDMGISCYQIEKKLKKNHIDPHSINGILITHEHNDHIRGLLGFVKKYNNEKPITLFGVTRLMLPIILIMLGLWLVILMAFTIIGIPIGPDSLSIL